MSALPSAPKLPSEPLTPPTSSDHIPYAVQVDEPPATEVRIGAWETPLCGCCDSSISNCCMAWCLPCISLAQVSHRIGFASYCTILMPLIGVWAFENTIEAIVFGSLAGVLDIRDPTSDDTYEEWNGYRYESYDYSDSSTVTAVRVLGMAASIFTSLNSITGFVMIITTWMLRRRVRSMLEIEGTCCEDCCLSFCCTCCSIAQMATQVKSYKPNRCSFGPRDTLPPYLPH